MVQLRSPIAQRTMCSNARDAHMWTQIMCASCEVPLCQIPLANCVGNESEVTYFYLWHSTGKDDLQTGCDRCNEVVKEQKKMVK